MNLSEQLAQGVTSILTCILDENLKVGYITESKIKGSFVGRVLTGDNVGLETTFTKEYFE